MPTTDAILLDDAQFVYKITGRTPRQLLAERNQVKAPYGLQSCYELGYYNPSLPSQVFKWLHVTNVNAFVCGQADYQNQAPCNSAYDYNQYDPDTFERANG